MFRPRVIPVLLLKNKGLVKTKKFSNPNYIGDPINAVRIFNDLQADELVFLDITASQENRLVSIDLVRDIGDEAFMPFAVGGGIKSIDDARNLIQAGAEKVVINTEAYINSNLISQIAGDFGNQSIIASIDVKKNLLGKYVIYIESGKKKISNNLTDYVRELEKKGAGEILINSIDHDGLMTGYNIDLIKTVSDCVNIPVIACGGAGKLSDLSKAYYDGHASAIAAGSLFVYHGPRNTVLINYPEKDELNKIFINE